MEQGYCADDVVTDRTDVPEVWWTSDDGVSHRYFVDIFIPAENRRKGHITYYTIVVVVVAAVVVVVVVALTPRNNLLSRARPIISCMCIVCR